MPSPGMLLSSPFLESFAQAHLVPDEHEFDLNMANCEWASFPSSPCDALFQSTSGAPVNAADESIDGMQLVQIECAESSRQKEPPPNTDHEATGLGKLDVYADNENCAFVRQITV